MTGAAPASAFVFVAGCLPDRLLVIDQGLRSNLVGAGPEFAQIHHIENDQRAVIHRLVIAEIGHRMLLVAAR